MKCGSVLSKDDNVREISAELSARREAFECGDASIPVAEGLLFYADPKTFSRKAADALARMRAQFRDRGPEERADLIDAVARIFLGLSSGQTRWNLACREMHGQDALSGEILHVWAEDFLRALGDMCSEDGDAGNIALSKWQSKLAERYLAEGLDATQARESAESDTSSGLTSLLRSLVKSVNSSNVRRFVDSSTTDFGNDYGDCLYYPLLLGASYATTNPPLVLIALKEVTLTEEELGRSCDAIPGWLSPAAVATRLVVLRNAIALRPVFLLTAGRKGYVCLQVDPRYASGEEMVREALYQYEELRRDLGGVPNVVFKLPATKAGLDACRALGEKGIGSTATVCFGAFQAVEFAEAMARGHALASYVVVMNGRLAGPVSEELDAEHAVAGRFAGVAVAKKLQRRFYGPSGMGYDPARIRILVASLRDHEGVIPDMEDVLGVPVITVFPDIRRAFDSCSRELDMGSIRHEMDCETLAALSQSEIFRQAYFLPGDPDQFRPAHPLVLSDDEQVQSWEPVLRTLTAFKEAYAQAEEIVRSRIS